MGSYTEIKFKDYVLYWNKNGLIGTEATILFQPSDKTTIEKHYDDDTKENHPCFSVQLSKLKDRLDLLGYTLQRAEVELKNCIHPNFSLDEFKQLLRCLNFDGEESNNEEIPFDSELSILYENLWELGGFISNNRKALNILSKYRYKDDYLEDRGVLDPFLILRCLAELDEFKNEKLTWEYHDLVMGGWIEEDDIQLQDEYQRFLILTEGKTDTDIIQKCLNQFRPSISDLFFFADIEDHPFGGTNDIAKFVKGLIDIKYSGNVIIIVDNDLAGNEAFQKISKYKLPWNFSIIRLPEHEKFAEVETMGTNGKVVTDINFQAVSIECFLDFKSLKNSPVIRWTNWDEKKQKYQGSFEQKVKNEFKIKFDKAYSNEFIDYDVTKLKFLIEFIINQAKQINIQLLP